MPTNMPMEQTNMPVQNPQKIQVDSIPTQTMPQKVVIPKVETQITADEPQITMGDMKVEPIVHSEVINKSAISVHDDSSPSHDHHSSSHSSDTSHHSHDSHGSHSSGNAHDQMSLHSPDLDLHDVEHHSQSEDMHINPSESSVDDETTVHLNASHVNDDQGLDVILGEDKSQDIENRSNIII